MITNAQWREILVLCGVRFTTATAWAKVFEDRVQSEFFSVGARELDDFVGQVLHETRMLSSLEEGLNYSADRIREIGNASPPGSRWRSLVPIADSLARRPREFANAVYGGRLGNTEPDDGFIYAGKGIPQITGKDNYRLVEKLTGLPLIANPGMLTDPDTAMLCGVHWWEGRVPDSAIDSVERVTRAVQGAKLGLPDRQRLTELAHAAMIKVGAIVA